MTKAELAAAVYQNLSSSRAESLELVEVVLEIIKGDLERGDEVKLSGFGKFSVRKKRSRIGRNPRTGDEVEITARKVVTFSPSPLMLKARKSVATNGFGN
ncbi:MAG: integration host factor subunit alpha [Magnetococcus sp. DMHC-6]